jgi:hypothetical protein
MVLESGVGEWDCGVGQQHQQQQHQPQQQQQHQQQQHQPNKHTEFIHQV